MNLTESHTRHCFQFHELNSHLNSKESETHNLGNKLGPFDSIPTKIQEKSVCKCHIQNTSSISGAQRLSHQQKGKIFPVNQIENPEAKTNRAMKKFEGKTSQVSIKRMVAASLYKLKSPPIVSCPIQLSESHNEVSNAQDNFDITNQINRIFLYDSTSKTQDQNAHDLLSKNFDQEVNMQPNKLYDLTQGKENQPTYQFLMDTQMLRIYEL